VWRELPVLPGLHLLPQPRWQDVCQVRREQQRGYSSVHVSSKICMPRSARAALWSPLSTRQQGSVPCIHASKLCSQGFILVCLGAPFPATATWRANAVRTSPRRWPSPSNDCQNEGQICTKCSTASVLNPIAVLNQDNQTLLAHDASISRRCKSPRSDSFD